MNRFFLSVAVIFAAASIAMAQSAATDVAMKPGHKTTTTLSGHKLTVSKVHYECTKCHAQFSAKSAKAMKMVCPCDKGKMKAVAGSMTASYECTKCHMAFTSAAAKKMKMACPGCHSKLTKVRHM